MAKALRMGTLMMVLAVALGACQKPGLAIPLLRVSEGECTLCEWDVGKNRMIERQKALFVNRGDPHSLLDIRWNGADRLIICDDKTAIGDVGTSISVMVRPDHLEVHFDGYILSKEDDRSYKLERGDESWKLALDSSITLDGEDVRGDELGLSGFFVVGDTIYILLNTFSFDEGRIKLYVCEADYVHGTSRIDEVRNCPDTLSPGFPPCGNNVIPTDGAFLVISDRGVFRIVGETHTSEKLFDVSALKRARRFIGKDKQRSFLIRRFGCFDGRLVLSVIGDWQTASEGMYLCLIDKADVIASIEVESQYVAPNLDIRGPR